MATLLVLEQPAVQVEVGPDGSLLTVTDKDSEFQNLVRIAPDGTKQVIAKVGNSGGSAEPQLHFEVRRSGKTIDPTTVLGPQ